MSGLAWKSWPLPTEPTTLRAWQDGRCAACGFRPTSLIRDHCHENGLVRGLLCHSCNQDEGRDYGDWSGWRAGDNPAAALRHGEVYLNVYGLTPLHSSSALIYYRRDDRLAWLEGAAAQVADGGEWPTAPWTAEATAKRDADWAHAVAALNSWVIA